MRSGKGQRLELVLVEPTVNRSVLFWTTLKDHAKCFERDTISRDGMFDDEQRPKRRAACPEHAFRNFIEFDVGGELDIRKLPEMRVNHARGPLPNQKTATMFDDERGEAP